MKTTIQILKDAKQVIIDRGWWQKAFTDTSAARTTAGKLTYIRPADAPCFCAVGAIAFAMEVDSFKYAIDTPAYRELSDVTTEMDPKKQMNIISFNDSKGRTKEEVLAVFDTAIERLSAISP